MRFSAIRLCVLAFTLLAFTGCDMIQTVDSTPAKVDAELRAEMKATSFPQWMMGTWLKTSYRGKEHVLHVHVKKVVHWEMPDVCYYPVEERMLGMVDGHYVVKQAYRLDFIKVEKKDDLLLLHIHDRIDSGVYERIDTVTLRKVKRDAEKMRQNRC